MAKKRRTEAELMAMLRRRYSGEAGAYAFIEKVRNDAGFNASRTIDAMAMSLWPSRGLSLYAFEIKCSRTDLLKELREPAKAEAFHPFVDFFYLVLGDADLLKAGELPETWGAMAAYGSQLRVIQEAPKQERTRVMTRGMLAALLRQAGLEARRPPEDIAAARAEGVREGMEREAEKRAWELERLRGRVTTLEAMEREFAEHVGMGLAPVLRGRPDAFWAAVRAALQGERDLNHLRGRIKRLGQDAVTLAEQAERIMSDHFPEDHQDSSSSS